MDLVINPFGPLHAACFTLPLLAPGALGGAIPSNDPYETNFTTGQRNIFRITMGFPRSEHLHCPRHVAVPTLASTTVRSVWEPLTRLSAALARFNSPFISSFEA